MSQMGGSVVSETIKILLLDVPDKIRDLLEAAIRRQNNMETVGEAFDPIDLLLVVDDTESDVVIMGHPQADRLPGICTHLLAEYPDLLILALSTQDSRAFLYERRIAQEEFSYKTPEDLIAKIGEAFSSTMY